MSMTNDGRMALVLRIIAVAIPLWIGSSAHAQATAVAAGLRDSVLLRDSAVAAVHAYELAAFHYWPSSATACTPGRGMRACAGGWCESAPGRAACAMGRTVPCPHRSSTGDPAICAGDAAALGPAYAARDSAAISRERDALLRMLARVSARLPGDAWVLGQRVHYLVAAGRVVEAVRAVGDCRAETAWCELLAGYVSDRGGRRDAAAVSFENAMEHLTPETRCEWRDVGELLSPDLAGIYDAMSCGSQERAAFETRLWWLSDPSWLLPGNDRRTAHFARRVEEKLLIDWLTARCDSCAQVRSRTGRPTVLTSDAEMIRVGPNDSWIVQYAQPGARGGRGGRGGGRGGAGRAGAGGGGGDVTPTDSVVWQGPTVFRRSMAARYSFVPSDRALLAPFEAIATDWQLSAGPTLGLRGFLLAGDSTARFPVPERYTSPYAPLVVPIARWQAGFLRRGDSALVVAVADLSTNASFLAAVRRSDAASRWSTGLVGFARGRGGTPGAEFASERDTILPARRWAGTAAAPWDSAVISIESLGERTPRVGGEDGGVLARVRSAIAPPEQPRQRVLVSDLFLLSDDGATVPPALDMSNGLLARLSTVATVDSITGLYWEQYGVNAGERVRARLELERRGVQRGWLSRVIRAVTGADDVVWKREWEEEGGSRPGTGRTSSVDLGALPAGEYELRLTVRVPGQAAVTARRLIAIAR